MSTNLSLAECIEAIKAGRKHEAKRNLIQLLKQDRQNETAWLWLSSCCSTTREKKVCLERALSINPNNENARHLLEKLRDATRHPSSVAQQGSTKIEPSIPRQNQRGVLTPEEAAQPVPERHPILSSRTSHSIVLGVIGAVGTLLFALILMIFLRIANLTSAQATRVVPPTWTPQPVNEFSRNTIPLNCTASRSRQIFGEALSYVPRTNELPEGFVFLADRSQEEPQPSSTKTSAYSAVYQNGDSRLLMLTVYIEPDEATAKAIFNVVARMEGLPDEMSLHMQSEKLPFVVPCADGFVAYEITKPGTEFPSKDHPIHTMLMRYGNVNILIAVNYIGEGATNEESEYYARLILRKLMAPGS